MSDKPKAIARSLDREEVYIWVWGDEPNAPACISKTAPDSKEGCRPLQALVAHLHLDEWEEL